MQKKEKENFLNENSLLIISIKIALEEKVFFASKISFFVCGKETKNDFQFDICISLFLKPFSSRRTLGAVVLNLLDNADPADPTDPQLRTYAL